uniref:protein-serine/threonine phosphatase n=1 Tax=Leersia perrieri TaxID=77586 RepID=A0A0D9XXQ3_9ORYZ
MLCSVEFVCSVVAVFAGLAHVLGNSLMSLCSPKFSPPAWAAAAKPKIHAVESDKQQQLAVDGHVQLQLQQQQSPPVPVLVLPAAAAMRKKKGTEKGIRPPRLVIPPAPVVVGPRGGFGDGGGGRETDVAAETAVEGEGFWMASRRGVRHAMEDGFGVIAQHKVEGGSRMAFYGVYDGHGGRAAVDFVADKLGKNVMATVSAASSTTRSMSRHQAGPSSSPSQQRREEDDVTAAIRAAYLTTDSEFLSQGVRGGACAATALVKDGEVYVSNVGDCRAVLCSRLRGATALTSDHTPARLDERLRIETTGGYVSCGAGSGVWRVQDSLAVSRAFGDAAVKQWVTCEPDTIRLTLTAAAGDDNDHRFLVLASDGLWCKVSNQEAADAVFSAAGGVPGTEACKELVAMARSRGSRDDITVMVVDLQRFLSPVEQH